MIDKNSLIKNLEDFKDTKKYSPKQLATFLYNNSITSIFFKEHVSQFCNYINTNPRTLIKYSKEHDHNKLHLSDSIKELNILDDIKNKNLITFWILNFAKDDLDIKNCNGAKLRFAIITYLEDEPIINLIVYVIKFCIIPYSENNTIDISLTETEKIILKHIHDGLSVPQTAKILSCSKYTIENHKKNICKKIDELNNVEYIDKKALNKLLILAGKIFK